MARFYGVVGFAEQLETAPGVWQDVITERTYFGDVVRNTRRVEENQKVNADLVLSNAISIVADDHANERIFAMRYVKYAGSLWTVTTVEVQRPRLVLQLGGVYNGLTPVSPSPA